MAKGIMYIDGQRVPFDGEKNVLAVIRKAGIDMPTFCYYSELSVYGACRMCVVEDERGKIDASCSMEPRDGMVIRTNTARLLKHRRMILELMLSSHCRDCTTCEKNGSCRLQELVVRLGRYLLGARHLADTRTRYGICDDHRTRVGCHRKPQAHGALRELQILALRSEAVHLVLALRVMPDVLLLRCTVRTQRATVDGGCMVLRRAYRHTDGDVRC